MYKISQLIRIKVPYAELFYFNFLPARSSARSSVAEALEFEARPVLPKTLGVLKYATSQNLTLDKL